MKICDTCGMKFIRDDYFQKHLNSHTVIPEIKTVEVEPEPAVDPIPPDEIVLHFRNPIEVTINGKAYFGKDVTVKDIQIASEIVRIARDAYGRDVLL